MMQFGQHGARCVLVACLALSVAGCEDLISAPASGSTNEKREVRLTVYHQDFAMVNETRLVRLADGSNDLQLANVSRQMDPQSVLLHWDGDGKDVPQTVSQIYDLGMENTQSLLQRYAGKEVELVRYGQDGKEGERRKGTLLLSADGQLAFRAEGQLLLNPEGTVIAPDDPSVSAAPALLLQVTSPRAQASNLGLAYLTRGLSWSADYVARLAPGSDVAEIECWATVTNQCGIDFPAAKVELIAGAPNRAARTDSGIMGDQSFALNNARRDMTIIAGAKRAELEPQAVGEGHAYPIEDPTTVAHNRMNRLRMFGSKSVQVEKDYSVELPLLFAWPGMNSEWGPAGSHNVRLGVQMAFWFLNRKEDGLGLPLPTGTMRVYEGDSETPHRYAGAALVNDTPVEGKVFATLAKSFDLSVEPVLATLQWLDKKTVRKSLEVTFRNQKPAPVTVRAVQRFHSPWVVRSESEPHKRIHARQADWKVSVPAGGETVLKYTVDLTRQ